MSTSNSVFIPFLYEDACSFSLLAVDVVLAGDYRGADKVRCHEELVSVRIWAIGAI